MAGELRIQPGSNAGEGFIALCCQAAANARVPLPSQFSDDLIALRLRNFQSRKASRTTSLAEAYSPLSTAWRIMAAISAVSATLTFSTFAITLLLKKVIVVKLTTNTGLRNVYR